MKNKKVLVTLLILTVAGGGYYIWNKNFKNSIYSESIPKDLDLYNLASSSLPRSTGVAAAIAKKKDYIPDGYIKYKNDKYNFYFYHSKESVVKEYDQGQGAMIITLENEKKVRGMQIFIVPYWDKEISQDRFLKDVPSGVRTNVKPTELDGVEAVTFNSVDGDLGATREVWTIRGGYLYEITTFQGVGDWFVPIMQTWRFI